jgi:hypothetical protein
MIGADPDLWPRSSTSVGLLPNLPFRGIKAPAARTPSVRRLAGRLGQARPGQAIELYETTLTDTERVLGPDHPQTRTVQDNLQRAWGKEPADVYTQIRDQVQARVPIRPE